MVDLRCWSSSLNLSQVRTLRGNVLQNEDEISLTGVELSKQAGGKARVKEHDHNLDACKIGFEKKAQFFTTNRFACQQDNPTPFS